MKKVFFILLFLPMVLMGQNGYPTIDTFVLSKVGYTTTTTVGGLTSNRYFREKTKKYDTGEEENVKEMLGDSVTTMNRLYSEVNSLIRNHVYFTTQSMDLDRILRQWNNLNSEATKVGLETLADYTESLFGDSFIGDYEVKVSGQSFVPAKIIKTANGNIRLTFSGTGYRVMLFSNDMIRLMAYPKTGENLILYKKNNQYMSYDKDFILRKQ